MIEVVIHPHRGEETLGRIAFSTLLIKCEEDYRLEPYGLLSFQEVQQLCDQLRRLPQISAGAVGKYKWREVGQ